MDQVFARGSRRSLVIVLTDLLDKETAASLLLRTRRAPRRSLFQVTCSKHIIPGVQPP
jgi:hypothetical protein